MRECYLHPGTTWIPGPENESFSCVFGPSSVPVMGKVSAMVTAAAPRESGERIFRNKLQLQIRERRLQLAKQFCKALCCSRSLN